MAYVFFVQDFWRFGRSISHSPGHDRRNGVNSDFIERHADRVGDFFSEKKKPCNSVAGPFLLEYLGDSVVWSPEMFLTLMT